MLNRLRPKTLAGWIGWVVFLFVFGWAVWTSRGSPLGFRPMDLPVYFVLALLTAGSCFAIARFAFPRGGSAPRGTARASLEREVGETITRMVARAEADGVEARQVRDEPWYADAVVDLDAIATRWVADGRGLADSTLTVPNPYFVLPLGALVGWGFAIEVREATRWATSPTPPVRWQNPFLFERLTFMGWSAPGRWLTTPRARPAARAGESISDDRQSIGPGAPVPCRPRDRSRIALAVASTASTMADRR